MSSDKKKVQRILKGLKKKAKTSSLIVNKKKYIENKAKKMAKKMTWPEREFDKMMKELGVKVIPQKIVGNKVYDFYEPKSNTLFEIDGDYWHGNSEFFKNENAVQRRAKKNDSYKNVLAKGMGYNIERIWESDLKKNYKEIKEKIKNILK
jgi:very-short-patch-repair endonuclease